MALVAPKLISQAISTNDYSNVPTEARKALCKVSDQTVKKKWSVEFLEDTSLQIEPAIISKEHKVPLDNNKLMGATTIFGRCFRVGGETKPKAGIRLFNGGTLYIDVSEQMARELARSLYEEVGIEGTATWQTDNWEIEDFKAIRITDYHSTDPKTAFEKLAEVSKGCWDGVDAEEFVRSLRAEEDEV